MAGKPKVTSTPGNGDVAHPAQLFAVIGSPVRHSLSPTLHTALYAHLSHSLGLPAAEFTAVEVEADTLDSFWQEQRTGFTGLSVTAPLKRMVADLVDEVHGCARATGVVNTVVTVGTANIGHNTDAIALTRLLNAHRQSIGSMSDVLIIGSGASAASAVHALGHIGAETAVVAARHKPAAELLGADDANVRITPIELPADADDRAGAGFMDAVERASAIVCTIPQPAAAALGHVMARVGKQLRSDQLLIELAYGGQRSLADDIGAVLRVDGREFLIQQGVDQMLLHRNIAEGQIERAALVAVARAALA